MRKVRLALVGVGVVAVAVAAKKKRWRRVHYLSPGAYIPPGSTGSKPIEGVGTSLPG